MLLITIALFCMRWTLALIEGARARGHKVVLGGMLYSDAMGAPGSGAEDYIAMIEHNIRQIREALLDPVLESQ